MIGKKNILITGSDGQLGKVIADYSITNNMYNYYFTNKSQLDVTNFDQISNYVSYNNINLIINCASLTNVNFAEKNSTLANLVNSISTQHLVNVCHHNKTQLIHISTDYVFDGKKKSPYRENDVTNPINIYGLTKLSGEKKILNSGLKNSIIIRTSWIYSEYNNNFLSKILNQTNNNSKIKIIKNKFGSPTNSHDLIESIFKIIPKIKNNKPELYHFSNSGYTSRIDFAKEVFKILNLNVVVKPIDFVSEDAKRPDFSALDYKLFSKTFKINIDNWKVSLNKHIKKNPYYCK